MNPVFTPLLVWTLIAGQFPPVAEVSDRELLLPLVRLVDVPVLQLKVPSPNADVPPARIREVKDLISQLADMSHADTALPHNFLKGGSLNTVFLPVGVLYRGSGWRPSQNHPALTKLVQIGPDALPYLLKSLDDQTPTQIVLDVRKDSLQLDAMWFDDVLVGNPANPLEQKILGLTRDPWVSLSREFWTDRWMEDKPDGFPIEVYRLRLGDVCLVAIGQIVGRDYSPVVVGGGPKARQFAICSPVYNKQLRDSLQRIWTTGSSRKRLLESLLIDFSTRGMYDGGALDDWRIGSDFQKEAIIRLLYYYPSEASDIIIKRLDGIDASETDDYGLQAVKNGVRADHLVHAVGWSDVGAVREALARLMRRASQYEVLKALELSGIQRSVEE